MLKNERLLQQFSSQVIGPCVNTLVKNPVKGVRCSLAALGCAGPWSDKDALVRTLYLHRCMLVALSQESRESTKASERDACEGEGWALTTS